MAKASIQYVCKECGHISSKWEGKCTSCGMWNTMEEDKPLTKVHPLHPTSKNEKLNVYDLSGPLENYDRVLTDNKEFNRVCGGGIVPGGVTLIGGDPGIGKSTLLLQVMTELSKKISCLYVSAEESLDQIKLRAKRLKLDKSSLQLATTTSLSEILSVFKNNDTAPDCIVIDSVQTLYVDSIDSSPGSISQVRAAAQLLVQAAKKTNTSLFIVGHVTKEGSLAGPKVVEHLVDTVLYFEGEKTHQYRILRCVKNRFGPTSEIGVFEMVEMGLQEVQNPSSLFVSDMVTDMPSRNFSGSAIFPGMEGTRPILVEIQALVGNSGYATPRRTSIGWDNSRLAMILAVLEKQCGLRFSDRDVYLNIVGGLKLVDPAADLAVASALVSSLTDKAVPKSSIIFGEVGLSGEIRPVSYADARIKEAEKLGFLNAFHPSQKKLLSAFKNDSIRLNSIQHLKNLESVFS